MSAGIVLAWAWRCTLPWAPSKCASRLVDVDLPELPVMPMNVALLRARTQRACSRRSAHPRSLRIFRNSSFTTRRFLAQPYMRRAKFWSQTVPGALGPKTSATEEPQQSQLAPLRFSLPHKLPMLLKRHFIEAALLASLGFAAYRNPALDVVGPGKCDTFEVKAG